MWHISMKNTYELKGFFLVNFRINASKEKNSLIELYVAHIDEKNTFLS